MIPITFEQIQAVMKQKGYPIFMNDKRDYNLNLVGIRGKTPLPDKFDDKLFVFWNFGGLLTIKDYVITTDPGLTYLKKPINPHGTAILKEGYYPGMWALGLHRGKYLALRQVGYCTVIRDFDRDDKFDLVSGVEETGNTFAINLHRAKANAITEQVSVHSAGCQVFQRSKDFDEVLGIAKKAAEIWGNHFSYTLLNEKDFLYS
jgi:hypothetical protein